MTTKLCSVAISMILVAGCEQDAPPKDIMEYPEAQTHTACILSRANHFSALEGNVIDLAYVAASGCKQTRRDLALAMSNRRTFVDAFMAEGFETDVQLIAERIYFMRSGAA